MSDIAIASSVPIQSSVPVKETSEKKEVTAKPVNVEKEIATKKQSPEEMKKTLNDANKNLEIFGKGQLQFSIDEDTGSNIVKLMDKETGEVIRQIPSESMLKIAKNIQEYQSVLEKEKA